jgi:sugar phosphate isomerase/epimerase
MAQVGPGGLEQTAATARAEGVEILDVTQAIAFDLEHPAQWSERQSVLRAAVDAARTLDAGIVYMTTGPAPGLSWEEAAARFTDAIGPVNDYARSLNVGLAIENTISLRADLGFVHRLADAIDLAEQAGVAVVADLFAAWTERDLEQVIKSSLPTITYFQVADFVLGTLSTPGRAVPGDGDIPIGRQLSWLREAGYEGMIELELLGPRIDDEGIARASARALTAIEAMI